MKMPLLLILLPIIMPTMAGAIMLPMRPKPAAQPLPKARMAVGYSSGVYV